MNKVDDKNTEDEVRVVSLESDTSDLGHVPKRKFSARRLIKSLGSKDAWFGDYDYLALFIPNIPGLFKKRQLPFYAIDDKLPYMLMFILGLQHALAMVGGLVVPPLLFGGSSGANLGTEAQQYLISACLIWSSFGSVLQISRHKIWKTKYYIGTGIISVTGTSFAFAGVALKYLQQSYENGTCQISDTGVKLPCPEEFGAILGTSILTGLLAILMAFIPPRLIRKLFPPLILGTMLIFIGAALVTTGITNWAGGSGPCRTDHTIKCVSGSQSHYWGSKEYLGLGFASVATILICEIFGSAFMKSASVFLGLVVGMVIGAATGYFNGEAIRIAPGGTFLWVHTFPLALRGQLVLPMLASWCIIVAETIGNVTASCDVSHLDITDESFMSRIQGGMLADSLSATLAGLATVPPLTTFAQNSGVIALTRNASRQSGYMCAFLLLIMGIVGKFGAIFVAAPPSVIGGFSTFLFGNVAASGARILAYAKWTRRDRFIAGTMFAFGFASLCVEDWFSYIFTYQGDNNGIKGLIQAVTLIIEEPYLISALLGVVLNACLPDEIPDEVVNTAEEKREWNQPGPILGETVPTPPPIERRSSEVVLH